MRYYVTRVRHPAADPLYRRDRRVPLHRLLRGAVDRHGLHLPGAPLLQTLQTLQTL